MFERVIGGLGGDSVFLYVVKESFMGFRRGKKIRPDQEMA